MKALRIDKKKLAVRDVEKPARGEEALVRVLLSGICNTDLEISRGYAGFQGTLGHEFVGVIESLAVARPSGRSPIASVGSTLEAEPSLTVGLLHRPHLRS